MYRLLQQQTHLYFKLLPSGSSLFCRRFISTQLITPRSTYTFSTLSCRLAAKNTDYAHKILKKTSKPVKPGKSASVALPSNLPAYQSFAQHLASRQSPTILYQSDSHTWFIVSCYLVGGFCIAWAGINFWNQYLYPLEGTPPSLSRMMAVMCVGVLALGFWFIARPRKIVQAIHALPSMSKDGSHALFLQIETASSIPGKQPSSIVVAAEDAALSSRLFQGHNSISEIEKVEIRRRLDKMNEFNKTRIMTMPFRQASYLAWRGFRGARTFLSNENFIYMRLRGKNGVWKIDRNTAWSLENGRALDRLIKHDNV